MKITRWGLELQSENLIVFATLAVGFPGAAYLLVLYAIPWIVKRRR